MFLNSSRRRADASSSPSSLRAHSGPLNHRREHGSRAYPVDPATATDIATATAPGHTSLLLPAALGMGALLTVLLLGACATRPPPEVTPVSDFEVQRYTGRWYEIARTDQRFEKGLVRTQAHYSRNADGTLEVVNRGFDPQKNQWKEAVGKARFIGKPTEAALKVSFFGPFYGGYNVVALDPAYQWALVIGSSVDSMWILSRKPYLSDEVRGMLLAKARALGVDEDKIVWVQQDGVNPTGM